MYTDYIDINIPGGLMALQIANPSVVSKVERLARHTGLSKTAAVEQAVDRMLRELAASPATSAEPAARLAALLAQLDRIPDRPHAADPLQWDEHGLPV